MNEFNAAQAENLFKWLWMNTTMSDMTLRFATNVPRDPFTIGQLNRRAHGSGISYFQLEFRQLQQWCRGRPSASLEAATCSGAAENAREGSIDSAGHSTCLSSEPDSTSNASGAGRSFHLHATVLCSNSAYFRARMTSAVGVPSIPESLGRSKLMEEAMQADECDAAAAVLHFFYTSQLARETGGCCTAQFLVQMMKVRACSSHRGGNGERISFVFYVCSSDGSRT